MWIIVNFPTGATRNPPVYGGDHLSSLQPVICPGKTCPNVVERPGGTWGHREVLGGNNMRATREEKYRVPEALVRYLCGFPTPEIVERVVRYLRAMQFTPYNELRFLDFEGEKLVPVAR